MSNNTQLKLLASYFNEQLKLQKLKGGKYCNLFQCNTIIYIIYLYNIYNIFRILIDNSNFSQIVVYGIRQFIINIKKNKLNGNKYDFLLNFEKVEQNEFILKRNFKSTL